MTWRVDARAGFSKQTLYAHSSASRADAASFRIPGHCHRATGTTASSIRAPHCDSRWTPQAFRPAGRTAAIARDEARHFPEEAPAVSRRCETCSSDRRCWPCHARGSSGMTILTTPRFSYVHERRLYLEHAASRASRDTDALRDRWPDSLRRLLRAFEPCSNLPRIHSTTPIPTRSPNPHAPHYSRSPRPPSVGPGRLQQPEHAAPPPPSGVVSGAAVVPLELDLVGRLAAVPQLRLPPASPACSPARLSEAARERGPGDVHRPCAAAGSLNAGQAQWPRTSHYPCHVAAHRARQLSRRSSCRSA